MNGSRRLAEAAQHEAHEEVARLEIHGGARAFQSTGIIAQHSSDRREAKQGCRIAAAPGGQFEQALRGADVASRHRRIGLRDQGIMRLWSGLKYGYSPLSPPCNHLAGAVINQSKVFD